MLGTFASCYICIISESDILHFLPSKCNYRAKYSENGNSYSTLLVVKGSLQGMAGFQILF